MKAVTFTTEEEIYEVQNEQLQNPVKCVKLKAKNNKSQSFLITTNSGGDYEQLTKIKHLDHIQIKWSTYNKKNLVAQCHQCAGPHFTEHHSGMEQDPQCVNCKGKYTANHKNCPVYLEYHEKINQVSTKKPPTDSTHTLKSNCVKQNISHATNLKTNLATTNIRE